MHFQRIAAKSPQKRRVKGKKMPNERQNILKIKLILKMVQLMPVNVMYVKRKCYDAT